MKPLVTIAIPAYNEEKNIGKLIENLIEQNRENFQLKQIIVISDGSTDKTDEIVEKFKIQKVKLVRNKKRIGKSLSQNKIIKLFNEDIIVFLDADILLFDNKTVANLIQPIIQDPNVGLVSGDSVPVEGKNLIEKVLNFSVEMKREIYENIKNKNNIYLCRGTIRAFSRSFAKKIHWKPITGEDAFSYLSCISKGHKFIYKAEAKIYFKSPDNLMDHLKQSTRFLQGKNSLQNYFDSETVKKEYTIPKLISIKIVTKYFLKNPYYFSIYLSIVGYSKLKSLFENNANYLWSTASSSKNL